MADAPMRNMGVNCKFPATRCGNAANSHFLTIPQERSFGRDGLIDKLKAAVGIYAGIQGVKVGVCLKN
jgi:hypothetical protein